MKITDTQTIEPVPVTILHLEGRLDGSNYESLIEEAKKVFAAGTRHLILDLSKLTYISSAGLAALHQVALSFRGEKSSIKDDCWGAYRWAAYRTLERDPSRGSHENVKLFSPTKEVREVFDMIGFSSLFEIYTDLPLALASFPH